MPAAIGLTGRETPAEIEAMPDVTARIELVRLAAGPLMHLGDVRAATVPKMSLLSPPSDGGTVSTRTLIRHRMHEAIGVLGGVSVATACLIPASVAADVAALPEGGDGRLVVRRPRGGPRPAGDGLTCMVGHTRRFNPSHQWIRHRILAGELAIQQLDVQTYFFRRSNMNALGRPRSWTDHLLWHHAAHTVDLFQYQTGERVTLAHAVQGPIRPAIASSANSTSSSRTGGSPSAAKTVGPGRGAGWTAALGRLPTDHGHPTAATAAEWARSTVFACFVHVATMKGAPSCTVLGQLRAEGLGVILPKVRDPRFVTIRRGGTLTDADHRLLALWAASCAEHVLDRFESARPQDPRPRQAIEQARAWARGESMMSRTRAAGGHAMAAARDLSGAARHAAYAAGQAAVVAHVAAHELGAAAYAIKAARAAAPGGEGRSAGRLECRWQRDQLPEEIRELVLDDQRLRNDICWSVFDR